SGRKAQFYCRLQDQKSKAHYWRVLHGRKQRKGVQGTEILHTTFSVGVKGCVPAPYEG
ncbi:hypothetical protein KI387_021053, partial [Taxus chinensis]